MSQTDGDLWDDIPSDFYIALGRRGQERVATDQCFLDGCENNSIDDLLPLGKKVKKTETSEDGSYNTCTQIKIKCKKCDRIFQFAMKIAHIPQKSDDGSTKIKPFMGQAYILDDQGKNLGFLGYF